MFAGIVAAVGTVVGVAAAARRHGAGGPAHRLEVELGPLADGLRLGASLAVNGACLTLAEQRGNVGGFDVVPETWQRTTLHALRAGDPVNLERSLRVGDPIDGHFVQGHIEAVGRVERIDRTGGEWKLWAQTDAALMPCIVPKGSIALDGVSLTLVDVTTDRFSVALIPTTLARTVLGRRDAGALLNVETDILARLVLQHLRSYSATPAQAGGTAGLTWDRLREAGFTS
jgi:riboflavin synthase alpha subunit